MGRFDSISYEKFDSFDLKDFTLSNWSAINKIGNNWLKKRC